MAAYYNEFDEKAAAWLRELIRRGLIAPGEVDTRSIVDVRPDDLAGYTQCHFFAGIGVWSYALRSAGWPDDRPVWTGSPPCQPFSAAGRGDGTSDDRHLWPVFFGLIQARRPPVFFGEQVASSIVLGKPGGHDVQELWVRRQRLSLLENRLLEHLSRDVQNVPQHSGSGMAGGASFVDRDTSEQTDRVSQGAGHSEGGSVRSDRRVVGADSQRGSVSGDLDTVRSSAGTGMEHPVAGPAAPGSGIHPEEHPGSALCSERSLRVVGREPTVGDYGRRAGSALREIRQTLESNAQQIAAANGYSWVNALQSDVEGAGYAFGAFDLCAAGFGAPHIRQRLKFVGTRTLADPLRARLERYGRDGDDRGEPRRLGADADRPVAALGASGDLALPDDPFWRANLSRGHLDDGPDAGRPQGSGDAGTGDPGGGMADAADGHGRRGERGEEAGTGQDRLWGRGSAGGGDLGGLADDLRDGLQGGKPPVAPGGGRRPADEGLADLGGHRRPGPTNGLWSDADWLLCRDGKWRPVEPGTFPLAHGAPARVGRLRGYGNAIVAPAAAHFIAAFLDAEADGFRDPVAPGRVIELEDLLAPVPLPTPPVARKCIICSGAGECTGPRRTCGACNGSGAMR